MEDFFCTEWPITNRDCALSSLFPDENPGALNDEGEFTVIPKNAPPDASLRIRACETERNYATG